MTPESWEKMKEIFHKALALTPAERPAFLSEACREDVKLIKDVESLIRVHEQSGQFIDVPAFEIAADMLSSDVELVVGQRVGPYEIIAPLGKGGMGEVYLAQDTRLGRKVALKLLPSQFSQHTDRLRRFEQEAKAASALNQPNIITIHEIGKLDSLRYIITEYVDGISLRQRLKSNHPKLIEALDIAIQIASALSAAHEAGIIHRDIKPENVMLRRDRLVKVLDFGLAKLAIGAPGAIDTEVPTRAMVNTQAGMVMGTATYMSPEQASGTKVDARADIWSLGVVLYEMIAARAPFEGETPTQIIAKILEREPPALRDCAPNVPAELERIVNRALTKKIENRYQTINEMFADTLALKQELEFVAKLQSAQSGASDGDSLAASEVMSSAANTAASPHDVTEADKAMAGSGEIRQAVATISQTFSLQIKRHKFGSAVLFGTLFMAFVGIVIAAYKLITRTPPTLLFQSTTIARLTNQGNTTHATISRDGKYCVYSLQEISPAQITESVWLRQMSATNDRMILGSADYGSGYGFTFSPDGNDLYFVPHNNTMGWLYRMPALGGAPVKLLEGIDSPVSFSPDGKRVAYYRQDYPERGQSGVFIANADGTGVEQIASRHQPDQFGKGIYIGLSWSPDGKLIACALTTAGVTQLITISVPDRREQIITTEPWDSITKIEWLPDMSGLLMVAHRARNEIDQVWLAPFPSGAPRRVIPDVNSYRDVSVSSDSSKLVTIRNSNQSSVWLAPEGDSNRAIELSTGDVGFLTWGSDNGLCWTPDGHIIYVSHVTGSPEIWIMDSQGNNRRQLTNGGYNIAPSVSRDGHYIVFISGRGGAHNVWRMNPDGNNATQLTTTGAADLIPIVTPDGSALIYTAEVNGKLSLWKVPMAGGNPEKFIDHHARALTISPDGTLIAYQYSEQQPGLFGIPTKLAVASLATGETSQTFDLKAPPNYYTLRWTPDGGALIYSIRENIWRQELAGGPPTQLTTFSDLDRAMIAFDLSPDGKQFICQRGRPVRDAVLITDAARSP